MSANRTAVTSVQPKKGDNRRICTTGVRSLRFLSKPHCVNSTLAAGPAFEEQNIILTVRSVSLNDVRKRDNIQQRVKRGILNSNFETRVCRHYARFLSEEKVGSVI